MLGRIQETYINPSGLKINIKVHAKNLLGYNQVYRYKIPRLR